MSALTIIPKAGRLKPELRLAKAVSEFEADLTPEQKVSFRASRIQSRDAPPEAADFMRLVGEVDRLARRSSGSRCFGPRLTNVLQAVQQYASLGDVVLGGSQNLTACGVWAAVRLSLLVSSEPVSAPSPRWKGSLGQPR